MTALEYLIELIKAGGEFPDAAYKAAQEFKVDQAELEKEYDEATTR